MSPHPGMPPAPQKLSLKKKTPNHRPAENQGGLFLGWVTVSVNSQPPRPVFFPQVRV